MQAVNGIDREMRGKAISDLKEQVERLGPHEYKVNSQSGNGKYQVLRTELGWRCSCPDHVFRDVKCKHIWAVEFSNKLRLEVQKNIVIEPVLKINECPRCRSPFIVKHGIQHNKYSDLQTYSCKKCNRRFVVNLGFEKMKASPQIITSAMQLYFTGESLRSVQKFLSLQGVNVGHVTIYRWIGKYVKLMEKYLEQVKPQLSGTWRADELYVKMKGNQKYLFALMDDQTRFWIAQQIADNKGTSDVRPMFKEGAEIAGKRPDQVITDGARNFQEAIHKEYWDKAKSIRTVHTRDIRLDGKVHNNKMERMNGELRDREKVMRGLKEENTPILTGMQIFHNYFRPHEGLKGKTPAQASGIEIEGSNKWITLIENAAMSERETKRRSGVVSS